MASAFGFRESKERYGLHYREAYGFLKDSQFYSNQDLRTYQVRAAEAFVEKAITNTPYYRSPVYQDSWRDSKNISKFPVLTKEKVRDNLENLFPINLSSIAHRWTHTSGTTGKSLIFPMSVRCFQREYAFRALHYSWSGADFDAKPRIATLAGHPVTYRARMSPPFWARDYWNNWLIFSSYHMTERSLKFYIKKLEEFNPVLVLGYPSSAYLLALAYRKYGSKRLGLKAVYTASETLTELQRQVIEGAFQVKVYNWYGNSEMVANIVECEMGELHLKLEHSFVEIVDDHGDPVKPGSTGKLICTGFGNEAFPLIRYEVGDMVTLSQMQQARCGRGGILIERVEGRMEDYVVTPDGRFIGRLDHIFKDSRNVVESQIYQDNTEEIVLRVVRSKQYNQGDENQLVKEARMRLGDQIRIKFDYVSRIERTSNGKFRFIDSRITLPPSFNRQSRIVP